VESFVVKKAAVLGAGVMGAQIAAHLANSGVETILFDLAAEQSDPNSIAKTSIQSLKKLKPSPLGSNEILAKIQPANYDSDLAQLTDCDFIVEAISERIDWKQNLYQKIQSHINEKAIFASNTSGLSIEALKSVLSPELQTRFCGVHFFNPPRYMKLVELIPHTSTDKSILSQLEGFLVSRLGKGVIIAKDTPNFIGNRVGVFSLLSTLHYAEKFKISPELVDALTGTLLGRPKSATYRTMDVVGLDTLAHVVNTMHSQLKDDPWFDQFQLPNWITGLIEKGSLGQKTKKGIYVKEKGGIRVYDINSSQYRPMHAEISSEVKACFKEKSWNKRFELMLNSKDKQLQFLWCTFKDLFQYCAYHLESIAQTTRDLDLALRWGYGWQEGPFEIWQKGDWHKLIKGFEQNGAKITLSQWATKATFQGPYLQGQAFNPSTDQYTSRSKNIVYQRQLFPDAVLTEDFDQGDTLFENEGVRFWTRDKKIGVVSFKSKRNCMGSEVIAGIQESIRMAEKDLQGLVIWQNKGNEFSVGANLAEAGEAIQANRFDLVETAVKNFQDTAMMMRYAKIPTVCALKGLVLGGGCEIAMHATSRVAAFETYMGLVEVGVGLIPAGGGSKELAKRASKIAQHCRLEQPLNAFFEQIVQAKVSTSALEAQQYSYLLPSDKIFANDAELLFGALKEAQYLADMGYCPPPPEKFAVLGRPGIANMLSVLVNFREGEFITDYEYTIGKSIAEVICGGEVASGSLVDDQWLLTLERIAIMALLHNSETQQRISHMLQTGKPLRN
tara:strand:- start:15854 stop:18205 length:2352 start_codon:yes stop_codon:yes gene_type:complete